MAPRPIANPPNPWHTREHVWLGPPPPARLQVFEERARTILSENDSPDLGFRYSVNPYRGCFHACAYCYARPTHQYLDLGAGTDFDTKIVVKTNAPALLRRAFARPSWRGETIALSGNTDCYQPLEASYGLTRGLLEVCRDFRNPVDVITKSALVRRDARLLAGLARDAHARVCLSIPFADDAMARLIEPHAPAPSARFETLRALADAGVPVGVALAPLIPGLNESQLPAILERARDAGARYAWMVLLRLPAEVKEVFATRLAEAYPDRAAKVLNGLRAMRGGRLYRATFGRRLRGTGTRWDAIEDLFALTCRRLGLRTGAEAPAPTTFRRPGGQLALFAQAETAGVPVGAGRRSNRDTAARRREGAAHHDSRSAR